MVAINLLKQMGWISPTVAETLAEKLYILGNSASRSCWRIINAVVVNLLNL